MKDVNPQAMETIRATARLLCLSDEALPTLCFLYLLGKTEGVIEASKQELANLREMKEAA